jgi:hypothetical protein
MIEAMLYMISNDPRKVADQVTLAESQHAALATTEPAAGSLSPAPVSKRVAVVATARACAPIQTRGTVPAILRALNPCRLFSAALSSRDDRPVTRFDRVPRVDNRIVRRAPRSKEFALDPDTALYPVRPDQASRPIYTERDSPLSEPCESLT